MTARLAGKVAIVSGGARGMGAAHARLLISEGAAVVIGDVLIEEGEALAGELGTRARFVRLDVRSAAQWADAVRQAEKAFGNVTVLVNNAGILIIHSLEEATEEEYRRVIDVNQVGVFLGMKAVLPSMRRAGGGSIINISSTSGIVAYPDTVAYVASKFAVRGMTKAAALDLGPIGIRVNAICPGEVETPMTAGLSGAAIANVDQIPLRRIGRPEDIAYLVAYLASEESGYVTGGEYLIDGGYTVS